VEVRDLFYGAEKLRALWRVLLFLVLTIAGIWLLATLAALLLPADMNELWELFISSAIFVAAALAASFIMMRGVERRPLAAIGLPRRGWVRESLRGALIGIGFIAALALIMLAMGWYRPEPDAGSVVGWLEHVVGLGLLLVVAAAAEELIFRGYPFQVLVEGMGVTLAIVISSAAFAWLHIFNPEVGPIALFNIALAGILMAVAYLRTRSLWVAIGLHWGWNWVMAAIFDLPVSGIDFDVPGYDIRAVGPDGITGGAFGPEAGLMTTLLSLPVILWAVRTRWLRESPQMAELRPLVDARLSRQKVAEPDGRRPPLP